MKRSEWWRVGLLITCLCAVLCILKRDPAQSLGEGGKPQKGMFEWMETAIEEPDNAAALAQKLDITLWYQELSTDQDPKQISRFVRKMGEKGVKVYALVGSREWGFEENGTSLREYLRWMDQYNKQVGKGEKLTGIMVDVEPYIDKKWKKEPEKYMEIYVSGMKNAYRYAKKKHIEFLACIPNHYDSQGLEEGLKELVSEACDGIAVMDYNCGDEAVRIKTEAELARKYKKKLHCILEFQRVGKHGLIEEETYYNKGLKAADNAWEEVEKDNSGYEVVRDYHWTEPLREILEREETEEGR